MHITAGELHTFRAVISILKTRNRFSRILTKVGGVSFRIDITRGQRAERRKLSATPQSPQSARAVYLRRCRRVPRGPVQTSYTTPCNTNRGTDLPGYLAKNRPKAIPAPRASRSSSPPRPARVPAHPERALPAHRPHVPPACRRRALRWPNVYKRAGTAMIAGTWSGCEEDAQQTRGQPRGWHAACG